MVVFTPKIPITTSIPQGMLRNLQQSQQPQEKLELYTDISTVGILTALAYILAFSWMYVTAYSSGNLLNGVNGFTLSEAFQFSNRIGATVLIILYSGLYIGLMVDKGFLMNNTNKLKTSVVATGFCILLGMLLLFLIPPSKKDNKRHVAVAIVVLLCTIYNSLVITGIYNDEFNSNEMIDSLTGLTSVIGISVLLTITCAIGLLYFKKNAYLSGIIGISEIIIIISFCAVLMLFSCLPKLLDYKQICIGVMNNPKTN